MEKVANTLHSLNADFIHVTQVRLICVHIFYVHWTVDLKPFFHTKNTKMSFFLS